MVRNEKWELGVKGRGKINNTSVGVGASFDAGEIGESAKPKKQKPPKQDNKKPKVTKTGIKVVPKPKKKKPKVKKLIYRGEPIGSRKRSISV